MKVRTRIAPSPTGSVHIGTVHNALFAHALARHNGGDFILRLEDTDRKRYVEGAAEELYDVLYEFDLTPDEGPEQGGKYAPYVQSERMKSGIYMEAAEKLVKEGYSYYCFLTEKELADLKNNAAERVAFRSPYRDQSTEEAEEKIAKGMKYVIRLKVPLSEEVIVDDAILGQVKWDSSEIDDQVLIKSDGFPTYHLAVVVDDNAMGISHVTRSYEWLPSTPKQVLLYKYLGYEMPIFAHSSLILDPDGGKLSKRKGTVAARQFLEDGYLPAAIKNFLFLLGWAPPIERRHGEKEREIFSHEEFIKLYKLEDRQKTNAVFNRDKLLWFNQKYISAMPVKELEDIYIQWIEKYKQEEEIKPFLMKDKNSGKFANKLDLVSERASTLKDIGEMLRFFYIAPKNIDLDIKQLKKVKPVLSNLLRDVIELNSNLNADSMKWDNNQWALKMKGLSEKYDLKTGDSFMLLRVAITGSPFSPPLFESIQMLGQEEVLSRLKSLEDK